MSTVFNTAFREQVNPAQYGLPSWTHPEVVYWFADWNRLRDCSVGEKEVKAEGKRYLPQFEGMDSAEYAAFLQRATFYNFTGRTIRALVGSLFKRRPVVTGIPERLSSNWQKLTKTGRPFRIFSKVVTKELLTTGRFGVLLDLPAQETSEPRPYMAGYVAENILDWATAPNPITEQEELIYLVLREWELGLTKPSRGVPSAKKYLQRFRVLSLENGQYVQRYYSRDGEHADIVPTDLKRTVVPLRRGAPLDYIPFRLFGSLTSDWPVETPPLQDIAGLNISHFQSYALLEQGRFYTGVPVYYVDDGSDDSTYTIGPNVVWRVPTGAKPSILEFNGHGLRFLENACQIKEAQAASLGGRMIGIQAQSVSESDNQLALKERNEQSLLLDVSDSLDDGFTTLLRWWLWWSGVSQEEADTALIEFTKDFLLDAIGAREYRAIHSMYKDGVLPIEVLYDYMRKAEVIPDWMSQEEFIALLERRASFPNQPDADARAEGFPDRKTQLEEERAEEEAARAEEMAARLAAAPQNGPAQNGPQNAPPARQP